MATSMSAAGCNVDDLGLAQRVATGSRDLLQRLVQVTYPTCTEAGWVTRGFVQDLAQRLHRNL